MPTNAIVDTKNMKSDYINLCKHEESINVFSQPWWLDIVCGKNNWDVAIVYEDRKIIATMPYFTRKIFYYKIITMPLLTQVHGPWIRDSHLNFSGKGLSKYYFIIDKLINQLPHSHYFYQQMNMEFNNWLPFFWKGFAQTTRYSYVIENIDRDDIFEKFSHSKRKQIKKANSYVNIHFDLDPNIFYEHHKETLKSSGKKIFYSRETLVDIINISRENNSGFVISAHDKSNNKIHGALFVLYGKNSAYNLISTFDNKLKIFGASGLLILEAIQFLRGKSKDFDFEGSMDFNISQSFRQFGAIPKPYHAIKKIDSLIINIREFIKQLRMK